MNLRQPSKPSFNRAIYKGSFKILQQIAANQNLPEDSFICFEPDCRTINEETERRKHKMVTLLIQAATSGASLQDALEMCDCSLNINCGCDGDGDGDLSKLINNDAPTINIPTP